MQCDAARARNRCESIFGSGGRSIATDVGDVWISGAAVAVAVVVSDVAAADVVVRWQWLCG